MTTDKTFSDAAKTFQEGVNGTLQDNVNNGIKWFQNANSALIETQNKQLKLANEIYNKTIHGLQGDGKVNMNYGDAGKEMMDTMQKNIENISTSSKAAMKTLTDLGKQANVETLSKEAKHIFDLYNKQVEELTKLNQQSFDSIVKQFGTNKPAFTPLTENFKKELDAVIDSTKESLQTTVDSYNKFTISSVETNKEVFDKLMGQMNTAINANLKAWKDLMTMPVTSKETGKTDHVKASLNGSGAHGKKH